MGWGVYEIHQNPPKSARTETQTLPQMRPVVAEPVWRIKTDEGKGQKRLAVGVNEVARLLGLSPATIRQYVARGRIRAVRVGRRVLVPMEVLEKVMVEGVDTRFR